MTWDEVCDDPTLRDLPYKIETNGNGQIIMSPHRRIHSRMKRKIALLLESFLPHGEANQEVAIATADGVKSADVAWASNTLIADEEARGTSIFEVAPEICVAVMSRSNLFTEMHQKMRLYFEKGAREVWLCDQKGALHFYTPSGKQERSPLCPDFPIEINLRSNS